MRKTRILPAVLACAGLIVCITIIGSIHQRGNNTEVPEEALTVLMAYMDAYKTGPKESVAFAHFEDDFIRTAYLNTDDRLIEYEIENMEMLSDSLVALTILIKTTQTVSYWGDDFYPVYNFLVKIEDEWYFVNGVSHIPPSIQDGLDVNKYTYAEENMIDHDDVFAIDLEPTS